MSTSPERIEDRPEDRIVNLLSQWLARHLGDSELRERLEEIGTADLCPHEAEAVGDVLEALDAGASHGQVEVAVREALEALAMG